MSTYQYSLNPFYTEALFNDDSDSEGCRFNFLPPIKQKSIKISKLNTQSEIIKPRKDSEADIFIPRMMPDW